MRWRSSLSCIMTMASNGGLDEHGGSNGGVGGSGGTVGMDVAGEGGTGGGSSGERKVKKLRVRQKRTPVAWGYSALSCVILLRIYLF